MSFTLIAGLVGAATELERHRSSPIFTVGMPPMLLRINYLPANDPGTILRAPKSGSSIAANASHGRES
jgi:hypothetical protein